MFRTPPPPQFCDSQTPNPSLEIILLLVQGGLCSQPKASVLGRSPWDLGNQGPIIPKAGVPKIRGTFVGITIIRTVVFWGSTLGFPCFRKLPDRPNQAIWVLSWGAVYDSADGLFREGLWSTFNLRRSTAAQLGCFRTTEPFTVLVESWVKCFSWQFP